MPVERNAREYNMNHKHRGLALIFNHEFFDIPSLKARAGTNVDCEELRKALKRLDFDVSVHKDCKLRDILKHIEKAASIDHTDNDCIAIVILSHGEHGYIYAKDVQYKLDNIWHYFTSHICPTLAGKPKLFFIQACQGDRLDSGIMLEKNVTETDGESSMSYKIPIHADFLFSYSTIPGEYNYQIFITISLLSFSVRQVTILGATPPTARGIFSRSSKSSMRMEKSTIFSHCSHSLVNVLPWILNRTCHLPRLWMARNKFRVLHPC